MNPKLFDGIDGAAVLPTTDMMPACVPSEDDDTPPEATTLVGVIAGLVALGLFSS